MLASVTMSSVYLSSNISSHQNILMCFNNYIYKYLESNFKFIQILYKSVHFYYRNGIIFPYIYCVFHHFKKTVLISLCVLKNGELPRSIYRGDCSTGDGSVVDVIIGGLTRENHTDGAGQYLQIAWFYFLFYDMYHKHHSELFAITT